MKLRRMNLLIIAIPFIAMLPHTWRSVVVPIKELIPWRNTAWSSTRKIRFILVGLGIGARIWE